MLFTFITYVYYFKSLLEYFYPELEDADILSIPLNVGADNKDKNIPGWVAQGFSLAEFNFISSFMELHTEFFSSCLVHSKHFIIKPICLVFVCLFIIYFSVLEVYATITYNIVTFSVAVIKCHDEKQLIENCSLAYSQSGSWEITSSSDNVKREEITLHSQSGSWETTSSTDNVKQKEIPPRPQASPRDTLPLINWVFP